MFVLVLRVSRQQVNHPFSPSLSFILSCYHTAHWIIPCVPAVFLSSPFSQSLLLCFFSFSFTIITIYFPYNLSVSFSSAFLFSLFCSIGKKKIKKDFVVAASKYNEMPSLPSMHKFVLHFKLIFFLLYWILPILYRTELSSAKVQITQYRYRNGAFRRLNTDRTQTQ